ncbi:DUF547 domain-containing protein [Alteromonas sp. ASW11-19]|uniref:DUF547 domain-containing protein n=1 Tax=Alteromonas salexigens TaxID=2982530 RepID=A0ABT2VMQ2_9ALTE|nr:DUF547 domain-containing protein [Alteromonas salexigens]MCU7553259.1 DUF547 domain-containing protein [Alteromonas salexigens]
MTGVANRQCAAKRYKPARFTAVLWLLVGSLVSAAVSAEGTLHDDWTRLLQAHVVATPNGHSTQVDYAGMAAESARLAAYLKQLAAVTPSQYQQWNESRQLAFLINAYNAHTVALVLQHYPDIDSIRDIGGWFSSPWSQGIAPLLGATRSLDEIEHKMIRGEKGFGEPRIHFAVNCASIGCPALRREAYTGAGLDIQLEDQTQRFLADSSRNRFTDGTLQVSEIFKWYRQDFTQGWRGLNSLAAFLAHYAEALSLTPEQTQQLQNRAVKIEYLDYNWTLNDTQ